MSQLNSIFNSFNFCFLKHRLDTYKKWAFGSDCSCSAQKMAEAGFFQPNPIEEPDLAQCFVCMKELDGWEENDDPWKEHVKHQSTCEFIKLNKMESEILLGDLLNLQEASVLRAMDKLHSKKEEKMEESFVALSNALDRKWKRKQKNKRAH